MSDDTSTPITVNPSPLPAQGMATLRYVLLVLLFMPALTRFLTPEQMAFLKSEPGITAVATAIALLVYVWGMVRTRLQAKRLAVVAEAAPDSVAVVKGGSTTP